VDTELFSPERRDRSDDVFTIGFVGRLEPEKNVRFLTELEHVLEAAGGCESRFVVVGGGSESTWLKSNLRRAEFPGVLTGTALARAYANMDLFVFPSHTDTFGNVILEAMSSAVPSVVTGSGGPKFLVKHGVTGFVASSPAQFAGFVRQAARERDGHAAMRLAARRDALGRSWDRVFEGVYDAYRAALAWPVAEAGPGTAPVTFSCGAP
jgi:glycosyltransferase involved in cell wall biosynthesis